MSFGGVLGSLGCRGSSPGSFGGEVGGIGVGWEEGEGVEVEGWVSLLCIVGYLVVWRIVGFFVPDLGTPLRPWITSLGRRFEYGSVYGMCRCCWDDKGVGGLRSGL